MRNLSAYNGEKPYIFLSYSHKDSDIVLQIINQMISDGYRVWYDEGIKPGIGWDDFIASKINNSGLFLACISENYLDSGNCKDELNYSRDHIGNILLVYLTNVKLPDGMELRFGRTQAIPAYNFANKEDFFNKLYSAHGIDGFKDNAGTSGIITEPIIEVPFTEIEEPATIIEEPVSVVAPMFTVPAPEEEPEIKAPIRVNKKSKRNSKKKLAILIAAILIAVIILIAIIASLFGKSDINPSDGNVTEPSSNQTINTENTSVDDNEEDMTTASSETSVTSSESDATTTETETTTEVSTPPDGYENSHMFEEYNLIDGESYYNAADDFFNGTGAVYPGYMDETSYSNGTFYGSNSLSVRVPALNGYSEPVDILWYYINPYNEAQFIYGEFSTVPSPVNGEMSYASSITNAVFADGKMPAGTYYVAVCDPSDESVLIVTRVFYTEDR